MTEANDEFVAQIMAIVKTAVRDEMRVQLERNPAADRRRILDTALRFQQQKYEKSAQGLEAAGDDLGADHLRTLTKIALEEVGNEIRAEF